MQNAPLADIEMAHCWCGANSDKEGGIIAKDGATMKEFVYKICSVCATERVDPRPPAGAIGGYYATDYASHRVRENDLATRFKNLVSNVFFALPNERPAFSRFLKPFLFPFKGHTVFAFYAVSPRHIFEFGASSGNDLARFREAGWQVDGCEPSAKACASAGERGINLQNVPAEAANLLPKSFSCILLNNVLEHVHDPVAVISKAYAGLVTGGSVVIIFPHHAGPSARLFGAAWPGYDAPRHLWGFNPENLASLLMRAGFTAPKVYPLFQGRWAWRDCLDGGRLPYRARSWRRRLAGVGSFALTPLGFLAAVAGSGDFLTVVATKP